jgi:hypothetical protein
MPKTHGRPRRSSRRINPSKPDPEQMIRKTRARKFVVPAPVPVPVPVPPVPVPVPVPVLVPVPLIDEKKRTLTKDEYEIEKLVGKMKGPDGKIYFRVRWTGYASSDDTWETEMHLRKSIGTRAFTRLRASVPGIRDS